MKRAIAQQCATACFARAHGGITASICLRTTRGYAVWEEINGRKVKVATDLPGYPVVPNAREVLVGLYNKTFKELDIFPPDNPYRKMIENLTRERLKVSKFPPPLAHYLGNTTMRYRFVMERLIRLSRRMRISRRLRRLLIVAK